MLPNRLTGIDETNREAHWYLDGDDRCYFFGEYYGNMGYKGGPTNQLIINYKTKPTIAAADDRRRYYKTRAINTVSAVVRRVISQADAERFTWVPIPPSKSSDHPDYDDRLIVTLGKAFRNYDADIRPLLIQSESTEADHETNHRISPERLSEIVQVNPDCPTHPDPTVIALFDDLLTTGKHYKCCKSKLEDLYPGIPIVGVFAARRIFPDAIDDFDDLDDR